MNIQSLFTPPINQKRKAAIWILKYITNDVKQKFPVSAKIEANGDRQEIDPTPSYKRYYFKDLQPISGFSKDTFKYAIDLLCERGHINPLYGQGRDYNIIELEGNEEGNAALHDRIYQNEINTYNNDRFFAFSRWILPIIAIVISIISISIATCRKPETTILPLIKIDTIRQTPTLPVSSTLSTSVGSNPKKEKSKPDTANANSSKSLKKGR